MLAGSLICSTTVHTEPLRRIMDYVSMNDEERKLNADIIKRDEKKKRQNQSTTSTNMHQPDEDCAPEQQSDSNSVGAIEQDHFPLKLHKLLEQLEKEGKNHIIGWNPDGKSFAVFRPKEFASEIMAKHFRRQSRYKSFQRQLNLYAFKRECHGHIKGVYSHELFVRNNRELCKGMKRERASSGKAERTSSVGATTTRGVTSGRSSNHSEASSSQSPDQSNRKRPLQLTAQHERDMLLASQDRVVLAMKQKLHRMTNPVAGSIEAPDKTKADFYRSHSEPTFVMMSSLDCDNRNLSSMDQEASSQSISLIPNFALREGYNNTSSSSILATYPQDDMNLTYQPQSSSSPQLYKMAADIQQTTTLSAIAFGAISHSNDMVRQSQRPHVEHFLPSTNLSPSNPMDSILVSQDSRNLPTPHLSSGMNVGRVHMMGLAEEDDSGSIGTIDDFDNMMG